jgi:serine/threonine protein kinase
MELLEGETLAARMARGRMAQADVLDVVAQACDGLAAAHDLGVVHRDVSPSNIFLVAAPAGTRDGHRVKLLDFGIAFVRDEARLTRPGEVLGNPRYIPPEAVLGREGQPASDLYSIGVVLYEALSGRPPLDHARPTSLAMLHVTTAPKALERVEPGIDCTLAALVMACLAKRPEDRPPNARVVAAGLRAARERNSGLRAG